ncbi:MAG: hypothetical protein HY985_19395 [Magnetospirillum sp.]|nr:hypothetical protein [Magnetospirillum sp.]
MAELSEAFALVRGKKLVATADAETYAQLAKVFREAWLSSGERSDLVHCRDLFLRAFRIGNQPWDGADAAAMSLLLGDAAQGRALAAEVHDLLADRETDPSQPAERRFRLLATLAQAQLILGTPEAAVGTMEWAHGLEGVHYRADVSVLKELELLERAGIPIPPALREIVRPPTVVVFTGHPLDRPGEGPHFPAALEAAVRAEIAQTLDELDAKVGYSMAACGADLLFIEAMLERGAEVNVVMPFAIEDFIEADVRYAGARWEMRFRNALKLASTVTYATEERFLGHDMLYRFANQCLHGLATLRSDFLRASPTLLAVWDMMPGSLVGGAAEFIDQWEDISRLRLIDLDALLQAHPDFAGAPPPLPDVDAAAEAADGAGRVIRSMLFADIAGYSKLQEEHIPVYLDFLTRLRQGMEAAGVEPLSINTWGDAIFAVMDKAAPMAEFALRLQELVTCTDHELESRLPHPLSLRISLHAGPVFEALDPICGRTNFYGSHINRAARLEPVTVIGHVYATQQFVAVLTAEQSAMRAETVSRGEPFIERYVAEYVGVLSLAKDFGRQTVYHLRRHGYGAFIAPCAPAPVPNVGPLAMPEPAPPADADLPLDFTPPDFTPIEIVAAPEAEPAPSADAPADPSVEAVLAAVARMIEKASAEPKPKRSRSRAKVQPETAAAKTPARLVGDSDAARLMLEDEQGYWPGG